MEPETPEIPKEILEPYPKEERSIVKLLLSMTTTAMKLVSKGALVSEVVGKAVLSSPEHIKMIEEAGAYVRDLRELAGLTRKDVSHTVQLADESFLAAVENGTATLSFELILRLAALLARHDPIPFIIKLTRTYNPEVWDLLEKWGLGRLPIQLERERQFINIYRGHDRARDLSDEDFQRVLAFTRAAFEMALDFAHEGDT
ncbi:MAG: helix-turn-helix domain-containing protein [Deltaproteobacteria bacterium]|nr:helix-turn-helix domain-containing protein [Deltaproteobacteria bacterium]